jgi:hypothetical protein
MHKLLRDLALLLSTACLASGCLVVSAVDVNPEPETLLVPVNETIDSSWSLVVTDVPYWADHAGFVWGAGAECVEKVQATGLNGGLDEGSRWSDVNLAATRHSVAFRADTVVVFRPIMPDDCQPHLQSVSVHHTDLGGYAHGPYPMTAPKGAVVHHPVHQPVSSVSGPIAGTWKDAVHELNFDWLPQGSGTAEFAWESGTTSCAYEVRAYLNGSFLGSEVRPIGGGFTAGDAPLAVDFVVPHPNDVLKLRFQFDSNACQQWRQLTSVVFTYN